jgi:uncharacterized protein (TIGR02001 family)
MKRLCSLLMLTLGAPLVAHAAEASPHTLTGNVGLYSNYVFRGISQTSGGPAIQGGLDYAHSSGFYLGTWASNVGWIEDFQGYDTGNIEIDLYGGFRGNIGKTDFTFDVGAIQYFYPGDKPAGVPDADTTELYAAVGWKWLTAKYYYAISEEVFGFGPPARGDADGSSYLDISASVPIGETGLTVGAHWGTFSFEGAGNGVQDYDDWKISLAYDMGKLSSVTSGVTVGVAYTDTDADRTFWSNYLPPIGDGDFIGDSATTVWISKAF